MDKEKKFLTANQGLSMIEVVFVLLLTFVLLSALAASTSFIISASQFARNKAMATQIAKEKINQAKYAKQGANFDWSDHTESCNKTINNINYTCTTTFSDSSVSGEKKKVNLEVMVSWGAEEKEKISLKTILTNWEQE